MNHNRFDTGIWLECGSRRGCMGRVSKTEPGRGDQRLLLECAAKLVTGRRGSCRRSGGPAVRVGSGALMG